MKGILNVDLDGVVYPFVEMMSEFVGARNGDRFKRNVADLLPEGVEHAIERRPPLPTQWDFWKDWNMSYGEWFHWFRLGVEEGFIWSEGEPIEGAVEHLWRLSDEGWHIRIVTDRLVHKFNHQEAVKATVEWLDRSNVPYRSLAFEGDKSVFAVNGSVLVDDKPGNVLSFERALAWGPFSGRALLFDTPANQSAELEGFSHRVKSWKEVYQWATSQTKEPSS